MPGRSKIDRVDEEIVAASAEGMESHGVAHAPQLDAVADEELATRSALRASMTGTVVGSDESLDSVVVAALMR